MNDGQLIVIFAVMLDAMGSDMFDPAICNRLEWSFVLAGMEDTTPV